MIKSQYILDIFDLAFDDHISSDLLRKQIPFLTLKNEDHTGIGLFIYFSADKGIENYKLDFSQATNFDIEEHATEMIDGVEIRNPELKILADAIVHLKDGIIGHLEIWNKCGEDYIQSEPDHYELHQMWLDK